MSSKRAVGPEIFQSHEQAFVQHYQWLIRWALQLTHNDRARAEDLVQEVFAQFVFASTDLSTVQNIPAYLYTALRNTHVSQVRMAGRTHLQSLSIIEYRVAAAALGASDPHTLYQTQDQLRRVCQYACVRKQSSRAASVLILRFFHGYHISEVAQILGGTCEAVRQCLRFARNEARLFLVDPDALKFIDRTPAVKIGSTSKARTAEELVADLRLAIFNSRQGECLAAESLRALYQKGLVLTADNRTLAHVVSCPQCLDGANLELGLPLLAERHPADALGPDNSSKGGPGVSGGRGGAGNVFSQRPVKDREGEIRRSFLLRCQRRAKELFEHYPRELCVAVNGHVLGSHSVNSEISRLRLDITIPEPLSFLEVMSEQNVRLLVMTIDAPPRGEPTQVRRVELSEQRFLDVTLSYGHPWPMLEVIYQDPNFKPDSQFCLLDVEGVWQLNAARDLSSEPIEIESGAYLDQLPASRLPGTGRSSLTPLQFSLFDRLAQAGPLRMLCALMRGLGHYSLLRHGRLIMWPFKRKHVGLPIVSQALCDDASGTCAAEQVPGPMEAQNLRSDTTGSALSFSKKRTEVAELFDSWRGVNLLHKPVWSRPSFITAILSIFLIGSLLLVRLSVTPTVSAASLIERASAAEELLTHRTDRATYRVINLEERTHSGAEPIARRRIEIWRDPGRDLSVRRVYDEKGHLIAGEWSRRGRSEGKDDRVATTRTIYRRNQPLQIEPSARNPQAAIRNLELWQLELSAKEYAEMIARADAASVSENSVAYVISFTGEEVTGDSALSRATLVLRKRDLHPVEQTLAFTHGSETHEYRFVEASFEQPSIHAMTPMVFELDPELLSETMKVEGARVKQKEDAVESSHFSPPHPSTVATAELEVEVAYLLDQFRARFGDQIKLTRVPDGSLEVQGIVATEESKTEMLHALAPVINNPAVRVQISTTSEVLERQKHRLSDQVIVQVFTGSDSGIPVYPELRSYLSRHADNREQGKTVESPSEDSRDDEAVRAFAVRVVSRSRRALSHAMELRQLSERFSTTQMDALTPNARAKWFSMVRRHADALRNETSQLRAELQPIFFPTESGGANSEAIEISSDTGFAPAIERLYQLVLANDEQIRSAFAASSDVSRTQAIKAPGFQHSLVMAERIADSIHQVTAKE